MVVLVSGLLVGAGSVPGAPDAIASGPGGGACRLEVKAVPDFASPVALSEADSAAFMPAVAERGDTVLVTWQETDRTESRVAWALVEEGCVGPTHYAEDSLPNPRRPSVAATASGWVLAYEARDPPEPVVRAVDLDLSGEPVASPQTVSEPGRVASRVRVAARGDDVVFAWTDVESHWITRRGPVERVPPTPVGGALEAPGLINFPRVLIDGAGRIYLSYRDGGPQRTDFEVYLTVKEVGSPFGEPVNVSRSSGLMSDDVTLALEEDGDVAVVWVEQDDQHPEAFEVVHSLLSPEGEPTEPQPFGRLGLPSFRPSVTRGLATVWHAGSPRSGYLFFATESAEPRRIVPELLGGQAALVADDDGDLHLAFVDTASPSRLRYAWMRTAP